MNQGPVVGDEPCSTIGDVPLNVSSSKIDDVAVNAAKVCFSVHLLLAYFLLLVFLILFTFSEFLFFFRLLMLSVRLSLVVEMMLVVFH